MTKVPSTVDSMIFERLKKPLKIIVRLREKDRNSFPVFDSLSDKP